METRKTAKWEQLSPPIELHFAAFVCETFLQIWNKICSFFLSQTVSGYISFSSLVRNLFRGKNYFSIHFVLIIFSLNSNQERIQPIL